MPALYYADVIARVALTLEEWWVVPRQCYALGIALPAVYAHSEPEEALLAAYLTERGREKLCATALALNRASRLQGVPALSCPVPNRVNGGGRLIL